MVQAPTRWRNAIVEYGEEAPDQLLANPSNWRTHPKSQKDALLGSLNDLGWIAPVIVNRTTGHVVDGHARIGEAIARGEPSVPVAYVELTPAQEAEALAVFDPIAAMAGADREQLDALLHEVNTGESALQSLLADLAKDAGLEYGAPAVDAPEPQIDRAAELQAQWGTARGQLWTIPSARVPGQAHRLLCGDSTSADDVARLMDGQRAVLFATDPPYGISYDSAQLHRNGSHYDAIEQDHLQDAAYQQWLEQVFRAWVPVLAETAAWYLWHPMLTQGYFAAAAAAAGVIISRQIIWVKPQFIFGRGEYHWQHELCFYGWRQGHRPPFYGERNQTTVWAIGYDGQRNDRDHPTQKPAALWHAPMRNHANTGEVCAEPFSGSGSQLVAGEQCGRLVYACELEPKYVAVALERLAQMGLQPERVG